MSAPVRFRPWPPARVLSSIANTPSAGSLNLRRFPGLLSGSFRSVNTADVRAPVCGICVMSCDHAPSTLALWHSMHLLSSMAATYSSILLPA